MSLQGFSGSGRNARVWRIADATNSPDTPPPLAVRLAAKPVQRLAPPTREVQPKAPLPTNPHLLASGSSVGAGSQVSASIIALLGGGSMAHRLGATGPLPFEDCLKVIVGIRDALATLHAAGLVHLDVSPANIVLATDGIAVLVDTADVVAADGRAARRGTPPYTVPGVDASPSTDWIALGRVLTELASGSALTPLTRLSPAIRPIAETLLIGLDPFDALVGHSVGDRRLIVNHPGHFVDTSQRCTADFAMAPSVATEAHQPPRASGRKLLLLSVAVAIALGVVALGGIAWSPMTSSTRASLCFAAGDLGQADSKAGSEIINVDTGESNGCATPVLWSQTTGVMVIPTSAGPQRFAIGEPGDELSFGDWDCDGVITPALSRSGTFYAFTDWPQQAPVTAIESLRPGPCVAQSAQVATRRGE